MPSDPAPVTETEKPPEPPPPPTLWASSPVEKSLVVVIEPPLSTSTVPPTPPLMKELIPKLPCTNCVPIDTPVPSVCTRAGQVYMPLGVTSIWISRARRNGQKRSLPAQLVASQQGMT